MTQPDQAPVGANDNAPSDDFNLSRLDGFDFWGWEIHPAANAFPYFNDVDLVDLARDIHRHGLREPMILDNASGRLVDGRNRARALCLVGIEPTEGMHYFFEDFEDDADIFAFVKSLNLDRRHLSDNQRALAAARLYIAGWRPAELKPGQKSRDVLAKTARVSARSIQNAIAIIERGCGELIRLVEQDEVSLEAASAVARALGVERQEEILAGSTEDPQWRLRKAMKALKEVGRVEEGALVESTLWREQDKRYSGIAYIVKLGAFGRVQGLLQPTHHNAGHIKTVWTWRDLITAAVESYDDPAFPTGSKVRFLPGPPGVPASGTTGTLLKCLKPQHAPRVEVELDEPLVRDHMEARRVVVSRGCVEVVAQAPEEEKPRWSGKYQIGDRLWTTREIRGGRDGATGSLRTLPTGSEVIIQSGQVRPFIGNVYRVEGPAGEEWSVDEVDLTREAPEGALVDNDKGKGKEAKEVAGLPPGDDVETWQRGDKAVLVYPVQGRDGTSLDFGNVKTTTLEAGCIVTVKMLVQGGKLHIGAEVEGTSWSAQVTPDALERINKPEATGRQVVKAKPWKSGPRACLLESVRVSSMAALTTKTLPVGEVVWVEPGATGGRVWISAQGVKQAVEPSILRQVTDGDLVKLLPGDVVTALASTSKDISGVGAKLTKGDLTRVERVEEDGKVLLMNGIRGWRLKRTKLLLAHRPAAPISPSKDRDADPDFKKGARVLVLGGGARGERLDTPLSATVEYGRSYLGLYKVRFDEKPPFDFCRTMTREVHHSYLQPWSEPAQKPANNCPDNSPKPLSPEIEPGDEVQVLRALRQGSSVLRKYSLAAVKEVFTDDDGNKAAVLLCEGREWSAPVGQLSNLAKGKFLALLEGEGDDNCPAPETSPDDQEPEAPACPWPVGTRLAFEPSTGDGVVVRAYGQEMVLIDGDGTLYEPHDLPGEVQGVREPYKYPAHAGDLVVTLRDMHGVPGGRAATVVERDGDAVVLETSAGETITAKIDLEDLEIQGFVVLVPVDPEAAVDRMFEGIELDILRRLGEVGPSSEWPPEAKHAVAYARSKVNTLRRYLQTFRQEIEAQRKEAEEAAASQLDIEEIAKGAGEVAGG